MAGRLKRYAFAVIALGLVSALVTGCGDSADSGSDVASADEVTPVEAKVMSKFEPGMSEEDVLEVAGVEPVLTQGPTDDFPGGCVFFPLPDEPLADVLQICFGDRGLNLVVTALSKSQPEPPEEASPARAALIARADSVCQAEYGHLGAITKEVSGALQAFSRDGNAESRSEVTDAIDRFIANLADTHDQLVAFAPPEDEIDALTAYTDALSSQIEVLREARSAFAAGDLDAYDQLGEEFTATGEVAKEHAQDYGFTVCSASDWS